MGIVNPRPAMRSKEERVICARLRLFDELLGELLARGVPRGEAAGRARRRATAENPYRRR